MSKEPDIIRQDTPHQIAISEGSQVAASRSLDPNPPQVRKNFSDQGDGPSEEASSSAELPPAMASSADEAASQVFERHSGIPKSLLQAPDAAQAAAAAPAIVFERAIHDADSSGEPLPAAAPAGDAPVLVHAIEDRFEPVPAEALSVPKAEGPTETVAWQDRRLQTEGLPPPPPAPAALLSREVPADLPGRAQKVPVTPDNWQPLPPAEGRPLAEPPPASAAPAPVEPTLDPVPTAQAQAEILETASQVQSRVEESLGPADPQWVEMDFPARVVRLKIENDKVRTRLDQLEALGHPSKR